MARGAEGWVQEAANQKLSSGESRICFFGCCSPFAPFGRDCNYAYHLWPFPPLLRPSPALRYRAVMLRQPGCGGQIHNFKNHVLRRTSCAHNPYSGWRR
jgi:hypothetical protein